MRLVNVKERMPTEDDSDSAQEIVWVFVATHHDSDKSVFASHDHWDQGGFDNFISRHGLDISCSGVEICWLDTNQLSVPFVMQAPVSHVRRVEL